MTRLTFAPAAIDDIDGIWDYSADRWGIPQAERYIDDIRHVCEDLAAARRMGRSVDVRDGYLKYPVGRHMVFFRQTAAHSGVIRPSVPLASAHLNRAIRPPVVRRVEA